MNNQYIILIVYGIIMICCMVCAQIISSKPNKATFLSMNIILFSIVFLFMQAMITTTEIIDKRWESFTKETYTNLREITEVEQVNFIENISPSILVEYQDKGRRYKSILMRSSLNKDKKITISEKMSEEILESDVFKQIEIEQKEKL